MPSTSFHHPNQAILEEFEIHLKDFIQRQVPSDLPGITEMISYHLGWTINGNGLEVQGKRIRPLLVLLASRAVSRNYTNALPCAAAIELIHNYSLVHDDIEDQSLTRRGRPTLWKKYGIAQAINTGDILLNLAHISLREIQQNCSNEQFCKADQVFLEANLQLTEGQYLDISFESWDDVSIDDYWKMIGGKTAALLGACTRLGAICANASIQTEVKLYNLGYQLGLAFQVKDDFLGIWGDAAHTGKSISSDLESRKKTYPVLYGLEKSEAFKTLWQRSSSTAEEISSMSNLLKTCGAYEMTLKTVSTLSQKAEADLVEANLKPEDAAPLHSLVLELLERQA